MAERSSSTVLETFLTLISMDSPSGEETVIAHYLATRLQQLGCSVSTDAAGNIYGTMNASGETLDVSPVLFNAHMDTVPIAVNVQTIIEDGVIKSDGTSALGADDKAGIAVILTVLEFIHKSHSSHPIIKILFTVAEETGLKGAKKVEVDRLGVVERGYTLDSSAPVAQ